LLNVNQMNYNTMPYKIIALIAAVDWRVIGLSMLASVAVNDLLLKFSIPIASGIAWVFLKPWIEKIRKKIVKKFKSKN